MKLLRIFNELTLKRICCHHSYGLFSTCRSLPLLSSMQQTSTEKLLLEKRVDYLLLLLLWCVFLLLFSLNNDPCDL